MDDKSFDLLLESIEEMEQHMKSDVKLETTTYEIIDVPEILPDRIKKLRRHRGNL